MSNKLTQREQILAYRELKALKRLQWDTRPRQKPYVRPKTEDEIIIAKTIKGTEIKNLTRPKHKRLTTNIKFFRRGLKRLRRLEQLHQLEQRKNNDKNIL